jgi:hypothetical protein
VDTGAGGAGEVIDRCDAEDAAPGERCIDRVVGSVLDENDEPEADLDITVCGMRCFRGVTSVDGRFSILIDSPLSLKDYSVQPHGTPEASTFYYPLEPMAGESIVEVGTLRTVKLPGDGDLLVTKLELDGAMPPAQTVTSGAFTLLFQQGDLVRVSVGDALSGDEGRVFRARELDPEETEWFGSVPPEARVFALGPFEAEISRDDDSLPQIGLRVSNDRNWGSGSEVSVLALGTYLDPKWLTPSVFEEIGVARVSDDGEEVVLLPDDVHAGYRFITWIALEPR